MEIGEWWTAFANAEGDARTAMLQADTTPKKRRKRSRKKPSAGNATSATSINTSEFDTRESD